MGLILNQKIKYFIFTQQQLIHTQIQTIRIFQY